MILTEVLLLLAVWLFGLLLGSELGERRGWHRGRADLLREERAEQARQMDEVLYRREPGTWGPLDLGEAIALHPSSQEPRRRLQAVPELYDQEVAD